MKDKKEDLEKEVIDVIAEQLSVSRDKITRDTSFLSLGADSLDMAELVMAFEEKYDIRIPDEDATKLDTVGKAIDYVSNILKEKRYPAN